MINAPVAYISGPYRGATINETFHNIEVAREAAEVYWKNGYWVFCPHLNSALMDGIVPDETFLRADLWFMKALLRPGSGVLVMLPRWVHSEGSKAEHSWAVANNICIDYHDLEDKYL